MALELASELFAQKPHDIKAVFVADLHLSAQTPKLIWAFLALIDQLNHLPNLHSFYILGDWLDGWIGDDDYLSLSDNQKDNHWLTPILSALQQLSTTTRIFIMHGNRDFAIRQGLCDIFHGKLIKEPYFITHKQQSYRLEHGDKLCTDDKAYQRYRKIIQNPFISWLLLKQPLQKRRQLAQKIKHQSTQSKNQKPKVIMDVNDQAVSRALKHCDVLLHGHTHRPNVHQLSNKMRLVLGDWRDDLYQTSAIIGVMTEDNIQLCQFIHIN